jgi:hypothetical protein
MVEQGMEQPMTEQKMQQHQRGELKPVVEQKMQRRWHAGDRKTEADRDSERQGDNGAQKIFGSLMVCFVKSTGC